VAWSDQTLKQPARRSVAFSSPKPNLQAEYWVDNPFTLVKRNGQNVFSKLNNLHKGKNVGIPWILLADTLAGSIILLSFTHLTLDTT